VTAIYDFVPSGGPRPVDDSRYQAAAQAPVTAKADEYAFLKIRYKLPKSDTSTLITTPVTHAGEVGTMSQAPLDARFAVAVAGFGEWLRGGKHAGSLTPDDIIALANGAKGEDPFGYRAEFVNLVRAAKTAKGLPGAQ
jgi:Ca-activated chloride channel family protein